MALLDYQRAYDLTLEAEGTRATSSSSNSHIRKALEIKLKKLDGPAFKKRKAAEQKRRLRREIIAAAINCEASEDAVEDDDEDDGVSSAACSGAQGAQRLV